MRNTIIAGLALSALAAAAPAAAAPAPALLLPEPASSPLAELAPDAQQGGVRVWMDGARDVYQPGERMRVRVRSDRDGYLAVFMIDTNGDVDIIYPRTPTEDGWIEGGRTLTLGSRSNDYLHVRGGYGMGYVMAVTLDEPLELWRVQELYGVRTAGWDGNRTVFGDPFYAMDEIVRAIVPEGWNGYESVDYYTFHVGRRYRYPRYACYDGFGDWYYSREIWWDRYDCDRIRVLLVRYPWYYDTYRWRGPRRVYYERYYTVPARYRPLHGYKERTDAIPPPARTTSSRRPAPASRPTGGQADRAGDAVSRRPTRRPDAGNIGSPSGRPDYGGPSGGADASAPTTRRPGRGDASTGGMRTPDRSAPRATPANRPTTRGTSRPQQDDAGPSQQDRPVQPERDRPTFQRRPPSDGGNRSAEPRRESPPQRSAEPRREPRRESPPQRSVEPRRESPPQRSSSPPSSGGHSSGGRSSTSDGGGAPRSRPPRG